MPLRQGAPRMGLVNTEALPIVNRQIYPVLLCAFAALAWGRDAVLEGRTPSALAMPSSDPRRTWGSPVGAEAAGRPGLGEQPDRLGAAPGPGPAGGHCGDLPYGAGYEARQGPEGGRQR
jgi:hypothetical protein